MAMSRIRLVVIALSIVCVIFSRLQSGRHINDLPAQKSNKKLRQAVKRSSLPKPQRHKPRDDRFKSKQSKTETALLPIDRQDWHRLDNQECIGSEYVVPEWQHRLPYVVIGGTMKGGTEALWSYLRQHPQVVTATAKIKKEQHFFDRKFEDFATPQGIQKDGAQQAYGELYQRQLPANEQIFEENSSVIAIDNTPRYMFWSDRIPKRLMCVAPWVKIIFLLRNPVERAYSHYGYILTENFHSKPKAMLRESFEDWVKHDMKQLTDSGVLNDPKDLECWKTYLRTMPDQTYAILGKGLYVIQLRHWFAAMDEVGKSRDDVLILESQHFKDHTHEKFNQVTDFLGLSEYTLEDSVAKHQSRYSNPMREETQAKLESFFQPFNEQLYELLGWDSAWG